MGRWLDQWSELNNEHEITLWHWLFPLTKNDFTNKCVLDAGCGNGGNAAILSKYAATVVAVDLESTTSPLLHKRHNIQYLEADIEALDFVDEFDISVCIGVLHHLRNPEKGFINLLQSTKPGGKIAVWVYGREGNSLMWAVLEPLKRFVLLKLPRPIFKSLAHFCTVLGYFFAYSPFYRLKLSFLPYFQYFEFWRTYDYQRNYMNVYDKLNAPVTHFISKQEVTDWGKSLKDVQISAFNGVSWTLVGTK